MLGKFVHEVTENLTVEDLDLWVAYFKIKEEHVNKKRKKGKGKRR